MFLPFQKQKLSCIFVPANAFNIPNLKFDCPVASVHVLPNLTWKWYTYVFYLKKNIFVHL